MKKSLIALVTLAFVPFPAHAQGTLADSQPNWATNLFAKEDRDKGLKHDFGNVAHGTKLHYQFKLHNIYAVPLKISATIGCSCLTATVSSDTIAKEGDASIDVTMNTAVYTGPRSKPIYFEVSGTGADGSHYESRATLMMSAYSRADVVCNPGQLNFGVVMRGQSTPPQTIEIEYAGVRDWHILGLAKTDSALDVRMSEMYRRAGEQVGYRVTVALKHDAQPGVIREEVLLKTDDPSSPILPILVEATVQSNLTVVPEILNLGKVKTGDSLTKVLMVRGASPFHVVRVDGQGDGIVAEAETPKDAAQVQVIRIKYEAGKTGALKKQLKIKTDIGQEEPLIVTLQATVEP
jgi:hypothetical protein